MNDLCTIEVFCIDIHGLDLLDFLLLDLFLSIAEVLNFGLLITSYLPESRHVFLRSFLLLIDFNTLDMVLLTIGFLPMFGLTFIFLLM